MRVANTFRVATVVPRFTTLTVPTSGNPLITGLTQKVALRVGDSG